MFIVTEYAALNKDGTICGDKTDDHLNNWAPTREILSSVLANNKGADLPELPRLISTFVIRILKSIISKIATSEYSIL